MAGFEDLGEGARKIFLAGVGAIAMSADKSKEIIDDLVAKGELTVEQGKQLNTELKRKAKEATSASESDALENRIKNMSEEERAEFVKKVNAFAKQADAEDAAKGAKSAE